MQDIKTISEVADKFDVFFCDLWGVIHDGEHLYPHVLETIKKIHESGKTLIFLSNAPRLSDSVIDKLTEMGVKREWYHSVMTSGEAARKYLMKMPKFAVAENSFLNGDFYYQGLEKDAVMFEGLPQQRVMELKDAKFIVNGNFDEHGQPMEEVMPKLKEAAKLGLPMLCINPDIEIVKLDGSRLLCAGAIAEEYKKLGGKVGYVGKPHGYIFEEAMELVPDATKDRMAMIGDNPLTDIKGGKEAKIATILIKQGVLKDAVKEGETAQDYCTSIGIEPDYLLPSLGCALGLWRREQTVQKPTHLR